MSRNAQRPGGEQGLAPGVSEQIRWGRFVDAQLEYAFQRARTYSMALMGMVCFPIFSLFTLVCAVLDHAVLGAAAFEQLLAWRLGTAAFLGLAAWYCLRFRRSLSASAFANLISAIIAFMLSTHVPISLIYLEELGRSDHLIQICVFTLIVLACHPGAVNHIVALALGAVVSIVAIDVLGGVALSDLALDCVSLMIVDGVALGANLVWRTRNREAFLVTRQLANSEAELRKLREAQAQSAEQALERRDAQWTAVVGQTPVVVLTVDRTGVLAFANPRANDLGFHVGDLLDVTSTQLDGRWLLSQVSQVFREGKTHSFDLVVGQDQAESSHWTFYAAPVGARVPTEQVTLVGVDSTEAWRLRLELRRKSRENCLGSFVTSLSHDFNNLLMVIVGSAELLEFDPEQPPSTRPLVESILDASHRADALMRRMLKFVRGTPGRPELHDVNERIEDMRSLLRYVSGTHNRFEFKPCAQPLLVYIDASEFEQILVNLCANAKSAIEQSGCVTVSTGKDASGRVQISVQDDGCGISAEVEKRIFEPYFTTRAEYGGTGVGLATVRGLVESAGGAVGVQSQPNQGTKMTVWLPCAKREPHETHTLPLDAAPRKASPKIALVVDENPKTRSLASSMLERMGCKTFVASSRQSAIEQAGTKAEIDLLITDFRHDLDEAISLETLLRRHHPGLSTVYSTGHIDNLSIFERIEDQSLVVLQKPYTSTELASAIEAACAQTPA